MDLNKKFQSAYEFYQSGDLQQAGDIYREILQVQPDNIDVLYLLAEISYHLGLDSQAVDYLESALQFDRENADAYANLGFMLQKQGKLDRAFALYQKALELNPENAFACNNLGLVLQEKEQYDEAIAYYQKALQIQPNLAEAFYNLGTAFQKKNRLDEAIMYFQKAVELNPEFADAYFNLGIVFQKKKQYDEAIVSYQNTLKFKPYDSSAYNNLGTVLKAKGLLFDSIYCYQEALRLKPDFVFAHDNLGIAFQEQGKLEEAISCYQKALQLNPRFADGYYHLGNALMEQDLSDQALAAYDKTLECDPGYVSARWARCMAQLHIIYPDSLSIDISRKRYQEELSKLEKTMLLETPQDIEREAQAVGRHQPFYLPCQGMNDREMQKTYAGLVHKIMSSGYPDFAVQLPVPPHAPGEPLRVGFVSSYFYRHSVWKIPLKGWIENLDKKRFHIYGYHTGNVKDTETESARQCCHRFVEDIHSFGELCKIIRDDNLHVLIYPEIGIDQLSVKLAALRLAPVQCTSLGHPETSGLPTVDYYISSNLMEPPDADNHYTEKLVRLPNLAFYYTPLEVPATVVDRNTFGIREKSTLYLCSHSLFTYLPDYLEVLPRIARHIGDCQFLFIAHPRGKHVTEKFRLLLKHTFRQFNLNADDHIVFLPPLDAGRYHAINRLSDIFLDSIGWSANNSTFEALACDLPVVTLPGTLMRQRHCAAILTMLGITDTIVKTPDEYVELAVKLGKDAEWRRHISDKIAENKQRVYRDKSCISALEAFLEKVVKE